jgi:peptidase E
MPKRQLLLWGGIPWVGRNLIGEDYLLTLSKKQSPKICFIPTASGDSKLYIERFFRRYRRLICEPSVLPLFNLSVPNIERFVRGQDILFIGGGSTLNMLAIWHARKLEPILKEAMNNGTILSGVSAGSICWFEWGLSDSISCGKFEPLQCLGYLPGSNCPHFDGEPGRQNVFRNLIAKERIPAGYAADDGVALHFVNERLVEAVSIKHSAKAYHICAEGGKARQTVIQPRFLMNERVGRVC